MYTIEYNVLIYNRDTVLLYCKMEKFYFPKIYRDNFPQLVDICTIPYIIRYLKLQSYLYFDVFFRDCHFRSCDASSPLYLRYVSVFRPSGNRTRKRSMKNRRHTLSRFRARCFISLPPNRMFFYLVKP